MTQEPTTTGRAQQAASTAAEEGKHTAGVAADQAKGVAAEARTQAKSVVNDAVGQVRGQLDEQGRTQKDKLAGTLGSFGDELAEMASSGSGLAADVAHEVADRAKSFSQHLDGKEPTELLDDVRRFARDRPGTFLLGSLAAGLVVGRLLRGTKDSIEAAEAEDAAPSTPFTPSAPSATTTPVPQDFTEMSSSPTSGVHTTSDQVSPAGFSAASSDAAVSPVPNGQGAGGIAP